MHGEQHIINEKNSQKQNMHIDRKSGIAVIIGIGIIFATFSMITLPEIDAEQNDPWSYQTMRTKLMNAESNISQFDEKP